MESWRGFSPEDIRHIQNVLENDVDDYQDENVSLESSRISHQDLPSPTKISIERNFNKRLNKFPYRRNERTQQDLEIYPIPPEARLGHFNLSKLGDNESSSSLDTSSTSSSSPSSISQTPYSETSPINKSAGSQSTVTILVGEDKSYKMIHSSLANEDNIPLKCGERNGDTVNRPLQKAYLLLEKDKAMNQDASLELFHERQRLMEKQNKRKKELLTKAIADRKRQTQSEAKKIVQIQEELNRLDALLSTDVSILRNQIELASFDFNEAQKRYDKAECEFIEAKMHLFTKLERKELLTEHLCKIIETNEQRKAKKLSELMAKLEISDEKYNANISGDENSPPKLNESKSTSDDQISSIRNPAVGLISNSVNKSMSDRNSSQALESINLITAQNLDHRNDSVPCNLNSTEDS